MHASPRAGADTLSGCVRGSGCTGPFSYGTACPSGRLRPECMSYCCWSHLLTAVTNGSNMSNTTVDEAARWRKGEKSKKKKRKVKLGSQHQGEERGLGSEFFPSSSSGHPCPPLLGDVATCYGTRLLGERPSFVPLQPWPWASPLRRALSMHHQGPGMSGCTSTCCRKPF